jgi:hypothetical protein
MAVNPQTVRSAEGPTLTEMQHSLVGFRATSTGRSDSRPMITAGLGIFWVANQELPVFDPHYLFGYLTLVLVVIHVVINWPVLVRFVRKRTSALAAEGHAFQPTIRWTSRVIGRGPALDWSTRPDAFETYPAEAMIALPRSRIAVTRATGRALDETRRAAPGSLGPAKVSLAELGTLLHLTQGISSVTGGPGARFYRSTLAGWRGRTRRVATATAGWMLGSQVGAVI